MLNNICSTNACENMYPWNFANCLQCHKYDILFYFNKPMLFWGSYTTNKLWSKMKIKTKVPLCNIFNLHCSAILWDLLIMDICYIVRIWFFALNTIVQNNWVSKWNPRFKDSLFFHFLFKNFVQSILHVLFFWPSFHLLQFIPFFLFPLY